MTGILEPKDELTPEQSELLENARLLTRDLEQQLVEDEPDLKTFLRQINEQLRQFPELVHLLSDEEIAPVYKARMRLTNTEVSVKKSKKKGSKGLLDDGKKLADLL